VGYGLVNEFTDHLCTPFGTTGNYSATANLHNSHITIAPTKTFSNLLCLEQPFSSNGFDSGDSSVARAYIVTGRWISHNWILVNSQLSCGAISSQPSWLSSTELPTLNWLSHSLTNYFTSLLSAELHSASLGQTQQKTPPSTVPIFLLWAVA
jgi:hypothetical protein